MATRLPARHERAGGGQGKCHAIYLDFAPSREPVISLVVFVRRRSGRARLVVTVDLGASMDTVFKPRRITRTLQCAKVHPGGSMAGISDEQYVIDAKGNKKGVILSIERYVQMTQDLHDLAVVAERRNEQTVSLEEMKRRLKRDGIL